MFEKTDPPAAVWGVQVHPWRTTPPIDSDAWIELLRSLDEDDRGAAREDFARFIDPLLRKMTARIIVKKNESRNRFWDDALSIAQEEFLSLCDELVADPDLRLESSFLALLTFRTSRAFSTFLDTSAGRNPASGMQNLRRRQQILARIREQLLAELGRDPTPQEIIDGANAEARRRCSDVRKQGMIFTAADLVPIHCTSELPEVDHLPVQPVDDSAPITGLERKKLAKLVIEAVEVEGIPERSEAVRYMWASQLGDAPNDFPTINDLAAHLGIARTPARVLRQRLVSEIPQRILSQQFGIDGIGG